MTLTIVAGALGAACVFAFGFDGATQTSALLGTVIGTVVAAVSLVLKANVSGDAKDGKVELRNLLATQGLTFGVRLLALLLGAFALRHRGLDPMAYVIGFFGCYAVQHAIELRFVMAKRQATSASLQPATPNIENAGEVGR